MLQDEINQKEKGCLQVAARSASRTFCSAKPAGGLRHMQILGHGEIFKTKGVAQEILAAALGIPVAIMETAGEGGAWGIALLAAYLEEC